MRDRNYAEASQFLADFFGPTTTHAVEIRALPNQRGAGRAAPLFTREPLDIEVHCRRWDDKGRAVYFGCATRVLGRGSGKREDLAELAGLWADIDCVKLGLDKAEVVRCLRTQLFMPPSLIIDSGYGIHCYWLLREALDIRLDAPGSSELEADVLAALRQLAGVVCGDVAVCDLARVMRLPATHNTKQDLMVPCAVLEASWTRFEYEEVVQWLDWQRPVLEAPRAATQASAGNGHLVESDAFLAYARNAGVRPPLDVGARLAAMTYLGADDAGVHQTQLHVSASLVTHGADDDAIVALLMAATREAVGFSGENWNWRREEKNVRAMIASARDKFASPPCSEVPVPGASPVASENPSLRASPTASKNPRPGASPHASETSNSGASASPQSGENPEGRASPQENENQTPSASPLSNENPEQGAPSPRIIDLAQEREARPRGRPKKEAAAKDPVNVKCGDAVIGWWQESRGRIATFDADPYTYAGGLWVPWDRGDHHILRCEIQRILKAGQIDPTPSRLNAIYRYVIEHPDLLVENIEWDATGYIVCQDGVLKPRDGGEWDTIPHSPNHWAKSRFEVRIAEMGQGCPNWLGFLEGCFSDRGVDDRLLIIGALQEWFGSALVHGKPRELRKALWLHGPSRTGKTRILEVLRCLVGAPTCALKIQDVTEKFGPEALLQKRAWIADDAVNEGDSVNDAVFKVIVTGEPFEVRRRYLGYGCYRLDIPVAFSSNMLPKVKDQSDGVYNRSMLIQMNVVRSEEETAGKSLIEDIVQEKELAGVLDWALRGWAPLIERGLFVEASSMRNARQSFQDENNPTLAWLRAAVEQDKFYMVDRRDLYWSFKGWYAQEHGPRAEPPPATLFFKRLRALIKVGDYQFHGGARCLTGIKLTEDGLTFRDECPRSSYNDKVGSDALRTEVNQPNRGKV